MCSDCVDQNLYDLSFDTFEGECVYCEFGQHQNCISPECPCEKCSQARIEAAVKRYKDGDSHAQQS